VLLPGFVAHSNLLVGFHFKIEESPVLASVLKSFIALDCNVVLIKLNKDVTFSFKHWIEKNKEVFGILIFFELLKFSHDLLKMWYNVFENLPFLEREFLLDFFEFIIIGQALFGPILSATLTDLDWWYCLLLEHIQVLNRLYNCLVNTLNCL
jgi:hypothetical protein